MHLSPAKKRHEDLNPGYVNMYNVCLQKTKVQATAGQQQHDFSIVQTYQN